MGGVAHPLNTSDFSSYLLQAQASKAQVIGLANAGGDTINAIKQAAEFGIVKGGQKLAGLLVFISDVHSLGLQRGAGAQPDRGVLLGPQRQDPRLRQALRREEQAARCRPAFRPASTPRCWHYLNAVKAAGTDDGDKVMAKMKSMPIDDPSSAKSYIRADGRKMHSMYLFEVKKPAESKGPWDYYKLIATIPGEDAFRPLSASECPLVKRG